DDARLDRVAARLTESAAARRRRRARSTEALAGVRFEPVTARAAGVAERAPAARADAGLSAARALRVFGARVAGRLRAARERDDEQRARHGQATFSGCGNPWFVSVPSPRSPCWLRPQHRSSPLLRHAQTCGWPATSPSISVMTVPSALITGSGLPPPAPLP